MALNVLHFNSDVSDIAFVFVSPRIQHLTHLIQTTTVAHITGTRTEIAMKIAPCGSFTVRSMG